MAGSDALPRIQTLVVSKQELEAAIADNQFLQPFRHDGRVSLVIDVSGDVTAEMNTTTRFFRKRETPSETTLTLAPWALVADAPDDRPDPQQLRQTADSTESTPPRLADFLDDLTFKDEVELALDGTSSVVAVEYQ